MTPGKTPSAHDGRKPRRRTRLRSGKIADLDNRFIADCQIVNRTLDKTGARLRLFVATPVPQHFHLLDDEFAMLFDAHVIWWQGRELGVRLFRLDAHDDDALSGITALTGKFYAAGR